MTLQQLLWNNQDIKDPDKINIGQKIRLKSSPLPKISQKPKELGYKPIKFSSLEFQPKKIAPSNNQGISSRKNNKPLQEKKSSVKQVTKPTEQQSGFSFALDKLKNIGKEVWGRTFGDKDLFTGRNEQQEKKYQEKYNTPYSLEMDRGEPMMEVITYPDGFQEYRHVEGPNGEPVYRSKLGDLGLYNRKVDKEGNVCYQIKNDKGQLVTRCAETGNLITRAMGKPTTGHAWTRHGVYGDSLIYGSPDHNKIYGRYINKLTNSVLPTQINPDKLESGDMVDLYTEGSPNNSLAKEGRGNSHTGTVFKPYGKTGPAYIVHNTSGVYVEPLAKFGPTHTWAIMGIRRPGTKEHPYKK